MEKSHKSAELLNSRNPYIYIKKFENKRAKLKKASGHRPVLALHLMAQGLYNHTSMPIFNQR
ncbi:unnamed protein product [Brugia timori]|uniref:Engrail_1_C_sig domain-containing protein n=1 Tax=Brugia timori TaxID=42155 RepID=A0A0R3QL31_9BILA|nr:unnamed protein product [Brugia timori]